MPCDVTVFTLTRKAQVMNGITVAHWMIHKEQFYPDLSVSYHQVLSLHVGVV